MPANIVMNIAIFGGIASGKSEISKILRSLGYYVISADEINNEILNDPDYLNVLFQNFPEAFDAHRIFNKTLLKQKVFTNEKARIRLNKIAHPRIKAIIKKRVIGKDLVFVELPLLIESGMISFFDKIWAVYANPLLRIERLIERDKISENTAKLILNSQVREQAAYDMADILIVNEGNFEDLRRQVVENCKKL